LYCFIEVHKIATAESPAVTALQPSMLFC